jgi:hypothetical protein
MAISVSEAKMLLSQGRSSNSDEYLSQLFAIEEYPSLAKTLEGWPSEAIEPDARKAAIIQQTAAKIGSGPYYGPTLLTCGQVVLANQWLLDAVGLNVNPVYAKALARAAKIAHKHHGNDPLPWGEKSAVTVEHPGHNYGDTPVSGFYGTGEGEAPR